MRIFFTHSSVNFIHFIWAINAGNSMWNKRTRTKQITIIRRMLFFIGFMKKQFIFVIIQL